MSNERTELELLQVKAMAGDLITELVGLIKTMFVFGDCENANYNGKPIRDIAAELIAAETCEGMLKAFALPAPDSPASDAAMLAAAPSAPEVSP